MSERLLLTPRAAEVKKRTMNPKEGCVSKPRGTVLHPFSTRTLQHPSFMPLYMASGFAETSTDCHCQPVHPIIPSEFFYSDPTIGPGRRIPNLVTELRVFDCFQLNTPPPIMSACVAPPSRPDPFRSELHPTRDLGSSTLLGMDLRQPPGKPRRAVVQLSEEEDQTITNLLKLHHEEPRQEPADSEETEELSCSDSDLGSRVQQESCRSETELEAANTRCTHFSLTEEDNVSGEHRQTAETNHVPFQHDEDSSVSADMQCLTSSSPAGTTPPSTEVKRTGSDFIDLSLLEERMLSESEREAVFALLSLGNAGSLDTVQ